MNKLTSEAVLAEIVDYMRENGTLIYNGNKLFRPVGADTTVHQILDTGFDSLDEVELVMHLEESLDIEITDEQAKDIWKPEHTLQQVAERVAAL